MESEIYNCDCVEYMRTLPDKAFDLAIADPPYGGISVSGGKRFGGLFEKYKRKGDLGEWDIAPKDEFFAELFRVSKNQIIWGGNYFALPPTRCFIVWRKPNIVEDFSMAMAEYAWTSFDRNAKVFDGYAAGKKGDERFHPTQKPTELYAWTLNQFAKQGDKIFDPMMGSQSSRIAAYMLGFDFVGCELNKDYFTQGDERFRKVCLGEYRQADGRVAVQMSLFQ